MSKRKIGAVGHVSLRRARGVHSTARDSTGQGEDGVSECRDGARDVATARASSRSARVGGEARGVQQISMSQLQEFLFLRTNHPSLARRRITHPSFVSNPLESHPRSLFGRKGEIPNPFGAGSGATARCRESRSHSRAAARACT